MVKGDNMGEDVLLTEQSCVQHLNSPSEARGTAASVADEGPYLHCSQVTACSLSSPRLLLTLTVRRTDEPRRPRGPLSLPNPCLFNR
ncbi:unnamed protein product [Lota lota]